MLVKGHIPIEIPTKAYIKAYVHAQLGAKPQMNSRHNIGAKFYDLLKHETNEDRQRFSNIRYNAHLKLFVSFHAFHHRGAFLNETNIKNFNIYIEEEIKARFRFEMNFYMRIHPNFTANLPAVRRSIGIDVNAWDDDSMKKDYYRYRKKHGMPILNKNNESRLTFGRHLDPAF